MTPSRLVWQVGAYGLPGRGTPLVETPLVDDQWRPFLETVGEQRLAGFLHAAVMDGAVAATAEQCREVADLHLRWCGGVLRLERRLLDLAEVFEAAGIEFLVLKGTAVAHLVYPDPAQRLFGDLDLLFRSAKFDRALGVLADLGYVRPADEPRPGFDRRFGKGATLRAPDGGEVDAHRTLVFGTFGFGVDLDELFRSATSFELGGRQLRALGPETRLLHACYHAALGDPQPRCSSVRDVAQMLVAADHDPDRVLTLARQWGAQPVVSRAIHLCRTLLDVPLTGPIVDELADHRPSRREQRAIASYVGSNRRFATKVVASLPYLGSTRERAAFLWATALPSRRFAQSRGGRPGLPWIRRGLSSLLGRETRR